MKQLARCATLVAGLAGCFPTSGTRPSSPDHEGDTDPDSGDTGGTDTGSGDLGCSGVDFIFAVDSSFSMADEQQHLIDSFPGLIAAIVETLELDDFHIMVVDSDAVCQVTDSLERMACLDPACCLDWCGQGGLATYNECSATGGSPYLTCDEWLFGNPGNPACFRLLGAGHIGENAGATCSITGQHRYLTAGQPDLNEAFACIADVGTAGSGFERLMEAIVLAVGPFAALGGCNAGFVRDGAILVVTFVTDEDEQCTQPNEVCSEGDPASWKQALIDAKGGVEEAVVVLGLFGDNDLPNGYCNDYNSTAGTGAEPAPLLREFIGSFGERGHFCSVCLDNYSNCFLGAVDVIDTTCGEYVVE
jgi:hypothetical protein